MIGNGDWQRSYQDVCGLPLDPEKNFIIQSTVFKLDKN